MRPKPLIFLAILAVLSLAGYALWDRLEKPREAPRETTRPPTFAQEEPPPPVLPPPSPDQPDQPAQPVPPGKQPPFWSRAMDGDMALFKVTQMEVQAYLKSHATNAESLVTAFQVTRDKAYLDTALDHFPHDPRVVFQALINGAVPDTQGEWIDHFKKIDPKNAVGNYLAAHELFKQDRPEEALQELAQATTKPLFDDFSVSAIQSLEELHLNRGRPVVEAKTLAMSGLPLPHLAPLRDMSKKLAAMQQDLVTAGNMDEALTIANVGRNLGSQLSEGMDKPFFLHQVVGMSIERLFLENLQPDQILTSLDQSVGDRLGYLEEHTTAIKKAAADFGKWLPHATEADMISYFDRLKLYGEPSAMMWMMNKYGNREPSQPQ